MVHTKGDDSNVLTVKKVIGLFAPFFGHHKVSAFSHSLGGLITQATRAIREITTESCVQIEQGPDG